MFEQINIEKTVYGNGENLLRCGNVMALPAEIRALYGKAQCVYADPPFMTGEKFMRRRPYGEQGRRMRISIPGKRNTFGCCAGWSERRRSC